MSAPASTDDGEFYLRYYVGHRGKFGHEFMEFEIRPDGMLRYANNSGYRRDSSKTDTIIRKEVYLSPTTLSELKRIVVDSAVLQEDDSQWPVPDSDGRQELEVVCNGEHISFVTKKIGALSDVESNADAEGLKTFYFTIQDLRCMIFSLISLHFKIKPI